MQIYSKPSDEETTPRTTRLCRIPPSSCPHCLKRGRRHLKTTDSVSTAKSTRRLSRLSLPDAACDGTREVVLSASGRERALSSGTPRCSMCVFVCVCFSTTTTNERAVEKTNSSNSCDVEIGCMRQHGDKMTCKLWSDPLHRPTTGLRSFYFRWPLTCDSASSEGTIAAYSSSPVHHLGIIHSGVFSEKSSYRKNPVRKNPAFFSRRKIKYTAVCRLMTTRPIKPLPISFSAQKLFFFIWNAP